MPAPASRPEKERAKFKEPGHYTSSDRDKIDAADFAGPHKSYPIVSPQDVADAAHLVGKAANPAAVKARIIAIAKRKGAAFVARLPKEWTGGGKKDDRTVRTDNRALEALLYAPIHRVDTERREVVGVVSSEALDSYETVFDYGGMKRAIEESWYGNVREQHDSKKAVGRKVDVTFDDDGRKISLRAKISKGAEDTWLKVLDGTLAGFSIGAYDAKYEKRQVNGKDVPWYTDFKLAEISLVDAPSNPDAAASGLTIYRAAAFSGAAEDETSEDFADMDSEERASMPAISDASGTAGNANPLSDNAGAVGNANPISENADALDTDDEATDDEEDDDAAEAAVASASPSINDFGARAQDVFPSEEELAAAGYELVMGRTGIPILRRLTETPLPATSTPLPEEERSLAPMGQGIEYPNDGFALRQAPQGGTLDQQMESDPSHHQHNHPHQSSYGDMHLHSHNHTHLDGSSHQHPHMHHHDHHDHHGDGDHGHDHTHVHDHEHTYRAWAPDLSSHEWQGAPLDRFITVTTTGTTSTTGETLRSVLMTAGEGATAAPPAPPPPPPAPPSNDPPANLVPEERTLTPEEERRQRKMSVMAVTAIHHARDQLMRDCNCPDCQDMLGLCDPDRDGDDDSTPGLDSDHDAGAFFGRAREARLARLQVAKMTRAVVSDELRSLEGVKAQLRAVAARLATVQTPEVERMRVQLDELHSAMAEVKGLVETIAKQPAPGGPVLRAAEKQLGLSPHTVMDASAPNGDGDLSPEQEAYLARMLQARGYFSDQTTQTDLAAKLIARQRQGR